MGPVSDLSHEQSCYMLSGYSLRYTLKGLYDQQATWERASWFITGSCPCADTRSFVTVASRSVHIHSRTDRPPAAAPHPVPPYVRLYRHNGELFWSQRKIEIRRKSACNRPSFVPQISQFPCADLNFLIPQIPPTQSPHVKRTSILHVCLCVSGHNRGVAAHRNPQYGRLVRKDSAARSP